MSYWLLHKNLFQAYSLKTISISLICQFLWVRDPGAAQLSGSCSGFQQASSQGWMVLQSPKLRLSDGPAHGCFSSSLCETLYSGFSQSQEQQRRTARSPQAPHNLICKVTYHHCCHFLNSQNEVTKPNHNQQRTPALDGVTGGRLRTWLPPTLASNDFFTNSAANTISPYCRKLLVKGNQRQDKNTKESQSFRYWSSVVRQSL